MFSVLKSFLWPAVITALGFWISFFSVEGRFGMKALTGAEIRLADARDTLATLQARRDYLALICDRLDGEILDGDLVEERARLVLGFARADDVILTRGELERLIGRVE
ncbi:MAG: hypothetical protein AAFV51_13425 [Pseudomonadota bacterium]